MNEIITKNYLLDLSQDVYIKHHEWNNARINLMVKEQDLTLAKAEALTTDPPIINGKNEQIRTGQLDILLFPYHQQVTQAKEDVLFAEALFNASKRMYQINFVAYEAECL